MTCSPPHLTLTTYTSGSGGVNVMLNLSSSIGITSTGTFPTLFPTQIVSNLPPPAVDVSKLRISLGTPASSAISGSATILTFEATGGNRFSLNGEPGTCSPDHFTSTW